MRMSMAKGASSVLEEVGAKVVDLVVLAVVVVVVLVREEGVTGAAGGGAKLLELACFVSSLIPPLFSKRNKCFDKM